MAKIGLAPIYQRPRTTVPHPEHRIHPYLLRDLVSDRPNQVWCADIAYVPMRRDFLYLVDVDFRIDALEDALKKFGRPSIFNTDS